MRRFLFPIFILVFTLSANAQKVQRPLDEQGLRPRDGNALLDYCGKMVNYLDDPQRPLTDPDLMSSAWCAGYVQGTVEQLQFVQIAMMKDSSDTKIGPLGICIPFEVPTGQVARVFVKWLRDHPEKLHEGITGLTIRILHDAFACEAKPTKKEPPK